MSGMHTASLAICHFQYLHGYFHSVTHALANSLYKQQQKQQPNSNSQTNGIGKINNENDKADSCDIFLSPLVTE